MGIGCEARKGGPAVVRRRLGALSLAVAGACFAVLSGEARADPATEAAPAPRPTVGRSEANAGPTRVSVTIWVADIDSIDSANQNYTANVYVVLRWRDPRLAHAGPGLRSYDLRDIWDPRVIVVNEIGMVRKSLPEIAEVSPDGEVAYHQRYVGIFSQAMDLRDFPFDSHRMLFHLVAPGYAPSDVEFVADNRIPNPGGPRFAAGAGIATGISLPDFSIQSCHSGARPYVTVPGRSEAGYALEFEARRLRGYFYWKLLLPLTLIVFMSWLVFWIDPTNAGTQIGVATTAMLTLIAYRFAVDQSVPRVGYMTRMDYLVMGCSLLVFLALCQVTVTAWLAKNNRHALAHRVDAWSRVIYLVLLAVVMLRSLVL